MPSDRIRFVADLDDKTSSKLSKIRGQFDKLGQNKAVGLFTKGIGMGAGISAWGAVDSAISGVVSTAFDFVNAAIEDEASVNRLNKTLDNNVKGWQDHSAAIDDAINAGMKLAFTDDDLRASLGDLAARTHDVGKAIDLQGIAMDLARAKGLDLATASKLVGKVYGGNVAVLQRYGIAVTKGATATEALGEIQKATAGQAETFADTTAGSMQAAQIAISELGEQIGYELLPIVKDLSQWALDEGIPAMKGFIDQAKNLGPVLDALHHIINPTGAALDDYKNKVDAATEAQHQQQLAAAALADQDRTNYVANTTLAGSNDVVAASLGRTGDAADGASGDLGGYETATDGASRGTTELKDRTTGLGRAMLYSTGKVQDAADAVDDFLDSALKATYGPDQLKASLSEMRGELANDIAHLKKLEAIKHPTAAQRRDIIATKGRIAEAKESIFKTRVELAKLNGTGMKSVLAEAARLARAGGKAASKWWNVVRALNAVNLEKLADAGALLPGSGMPGHGGTAAGGVAIAGIPTRVGETGQELFVPSRNGRILSHRDTMEVLGAASGGGRGNTTINFNSVWPPTAAQAREIAAVVDKELYYSARRAPRNPTAA